MKKVLKNSLFYFLVLTFVLGNSFVSISFDFATKIAKAQTEELENKAGKPDKYSVCHANGSGEFQKLNVGQEALGGHFENNGTPLAGHEDDILLGLDNDDVLQCPKPEPEEVGCDGADIEFPVDLYVVGSNCDTGNPSYDSELVNMSLSGTYEVYTVAHRNALDDDSTYGQDHEEFTIRVNESVEGPVVLDQPDGIVWNLQNAGTFDFVAGNNTVHMDTAYDCVEADDPNGRNSVTVTRLCLHEVEQPTSVCGNGIVEKTEICDDGNTTDEYCGDESTQNGTYCSADCSQELALTEQCDEGSNGSQTCSSQCMFIQEECSDEYNLIVNNSFEEPVVTDVNLWQKMASVNGWNIKKASDASATTLEFHKGWSGNVAAAGLQYVELDGDEPTKISQNITTEAGAEYKLFWSFAARHGISAEQNQLSVELDGTQVATNGPATASAPLAQNDWTASNYVFTADSTNIEISFSDIGPSDSYGTYLDNVRLCKVKDAEPETHYAPWCSALLGALRAYFNPQSPVYLIYNNVADINNDEAINLIDTGLVTTLYYEGNDANCYDNFENPSSETREFYFQCEDPNVGWCEGLVKGVGDFLGATSADKDFPSMYDLNDDGVINLADISLVASLSDETECYTHYSPPFLMCQNPEPSCGNGILEEGEYCDGQAGLVEGYHCTDSCTLEANQAPTCVTNCGGGGSNPPDVNNVLANASCQNTQLTWSTSKDSLTWVVYGETTGFGSEYKSANFSSSHTISFDALKPNTTYYYQIKTLGNDNKSSQDAVRSFTTPSTESCGQVLGDKVEGDGPVPPQVLGDKEYTCDRGNRGVDTDIVGVFNFPDGSLIREECDPGMGVYIIRDQQKWRIPNWDYLHKYLEGQRIYNVDNRVIGLYKDWTGKVSGVKEYPDGSLLRSKAGKIYVIESGKKKHVSSLEELKKYAGQEIFDVNDAVINQY